MTEYKFHLMISQVTIRDGDGHYERRPAWTWKQLTDISAQNIPSIRDVVVFADREQMLTSLAETGLLEPDALSVAFKDVLQSGFHSTEVWVPFEKQNAIIPTVKLEPGEVRPSAQFRALLESLGI